MDDGDDDHQIGDKDEVGGDDDDYDESAEDFMERGGVNAPTVAEHTISTLMITLIMIIMLIMLIMMEANGSKWKQNGSVQT